MQITKHSIYVWADLINNNYFFLNDKDKKTILRNSVSKVDKLVYKPEKSTSGLKMRQNTILLVYISFLGLKPILGISFFSLVTFLGTSSFYLLLLALSSFLSWMLFSIALRGFYLLRDDLRFRKHIRLNLPASEFIFSENVYIRYWEIPVGFLIALFFSYNPDTDGIGILSFFDVPFFVPTEI